MRKITLSILMILISSLFAFTYAQVDVTFQVDMSQQQVSLDGVTVAGDFQVAAGYQADWSPGVIFLTEGTPGIYSVTVQLPAGIYVYKYVNGIAWGSDEIVPSECAVGGNRQLIVGTDPVLLDAVCYGRCAACPPAADVTFQVNMDGLDVTAGVFVAGSFQGWNATASQMTLDHDAVYSFTTMIPIGDYIEYKFINSGNWENVPGGCAQNGNRFLTVPEGGLTIEPVCYESCVDCEAPTVDITFQVDMSNEDISVEGVHITGSFQSWNPGASLMTDAGNGVYTYTASLPIGDYIEYKFVNGNSWDAPQPEQVPDECGTYTNRYLTVPDVNTELDLVCFNSCSACPSGGGSYIIDFEGIGEEKGSYASGTVNLSGLTWDMTNALIGTTDPDWKNGVRSARMRGYGTSSMTMLENKANGIGTISFSYRRYGTDAQVDWKVEYSTDNGAIWTQIGNDFTAPASNDVQTFSEAVNVGGNVMVRIKRATESGTANRRLNIDDIEITDFTGGTPMAASPAFSHATGEYFSPIDLEITCATEGATIYYTLDGSDPDNTSTEYTGTINLSTTTVVKAIAYAPDVDPSSISMVTLTFPEIIEVANLADLRAEYFVGVSDYFKVTGEVILTYQQSYRNQKFIQDASAGVLIDDYPGIVTTAYDVYDGITGIVGTLTEFGGMIEFSPIFDPGAASSTGNIIVPEVITISEMLTNFEDYESELVQILGVTFEDAGDTFSTNPAQEYLINDAGKAEGKFRTTFYDADYIGTTIPSDAADITGICNSTSSGGYITSRNMLDIVVPPYFNIISPNGGEIIEQGSVFEITWETNFVGGTLTITLFDGNTKEGGELIAENIPVEDMSYDWTVTQDNGDMYKISILYYPTKSEAYMSDNYFSIVPPFDIKITEIMYNPPEAGTDTLEFIELYNNGAGAVNFLNWEFSKGVTYVFPELLLNPGEFTVVCYNASAFLNTFGIEALQWTSGSLSNSGEALELKDNIGGVRAAVTYDDGGAWPGEPDGEGPSLTFCDPTLDNTDPLNWSVSTYLAAINANGEGIYCTPMMGCNEAPVLPVWYNDGWSGISSNLDPGKISMENLFAPAYGNMTILLGQHGIFWPVQNINTIGEWNSYEGYKVKFDGSTYFVFSGAELDDKVYNYEAGISWVPVLSNEAASVTSLIVPLLDDVDFMYDMNTGLVYWPAGGIVPGVTGALETLEPGFAYLTRFNDAGSIDFGASLPKTSAKQATAFVNNTNWNNVTSTGVQHILSIAGSALQTLEAGDVIGAFNAEGLCVGMAQFTGEETVLPLVVYGNDITTEAVDGMVEGEVLNFNIYRNGETLDATAIYNIAIQNHDGLFAENGLSMVSAFKLGATGVGTQQAAYTIYPNPGNGQFNIDVVGNFDVMITNAQGQLVYKGQINNNSVINLSNQPEGIYFIQFTNETATSIEKVIIQ